MKKTTRAGGPASIGGYRYQMLWSLRHVLKYHVAQFTHAAKPELVILEPPGGDLHSLGDVRLVDQIKSRSTNRPWSWAELVTTVLPDLYRVADDPDRRTRYRFITNGRIGPLLVALQLLRSPQAASQPAADSPAVVDSSNPAGHPRNSARSASRRTKRKPLTADALVDQAVAAMTASKRDRVCYILANLECIGERSETDIEHEVDGLLLRLVTYREQVPEKRNALLAKLEALAAQGNQSVRCAELLVSIGMNAQPLSWTQLRSRAQEALTDFINRSGYEARLDARNHQALVRRISDWPKDLPVLVLSGESGQGKSWQLCRLALQLSSEPGLVMALRSRGSEKETLDEIGQILWNEVAGHDAAIPLRQIARRVRELCPEAPNPWLTILVDQVNGTDEAKSLARFDWGTLGIRTVLTCNSDCSQELRIAMVPEKSIVRVNDFSLEELHRYLETRLGSNWPQIPSDVQAVLRRPLLARVYCDERSDDPAWRPTNEYELFDQCWQQLLRPAIANSHLIRPKLASLAFRLVRHPDTARYPWNATDLESARMTDPEISALIARGWLRQTQDQHYELYHDRLLNWAAAVGAANAVAASEISCDELVTSIASLRATHYVVQSRGLQYFLLDAMWLLLDHEPKARDVLQQLLILIEQHDSHYEGSIRTLGSKLTAALEHRLRMLTGGADDPPPYLIDGIANCIAHFGAEVAIPVGRRLIGQASAGLIRAAYRILTQHPSPELISRLWELHRTLPNAGEDREVYNISRRALAASARVAQGWLPAQVEASADAPRELALLADVCFDLDDPTIWGKVRHAFLNRTGPDSEYLLALLIEQNRDVSAIPWLRDRVQHAQPITRCAVFCALSAIDPHYALEVLPVIGPFAAAQLRKDGIARLLVHQRAATVARIAEVLAATPDSLSWASGLQGMENSLSPEIIDCWLDAYRLEIEQRRRAEPAGRAIECWPALMALSRVYRLDLLRCFEKRRGSALGAYLRDGLLDRGTRIGSSVDHTADLALCILRKLGGTHFEAVVHSWLGRESEYGRLDGIEYAHECPSATTTELLFSICMRDEGTDLIRLVRQQATRALALLGEWGCVIQSVLHWGVAVSRGLAELRADQTPLDDGQLTEALEAINEDAANVPNAVLTVGIAGRRDYLPTIRNLLSGAEVGSDVARACLIALDDLRDDSREVIGLLHRHLGGPHVHLAARRLLRIGSPECLRILQSHLHASYSTYLAANLLQCNSTRADAARAVWRQLQITHSKFDVDALVDSIGLLEEDECREYLRERAFAAEGALWIVGSKIRAVRGLTQFDRESAIVAARKAVADSSSHDRPDYPRLLIELDPIESSAFLLAVAETESSEPLLSAIARAIPAECAEEFVRACLQSDSGRKRAVGCRMARSCALESVAIDAELAELDGCIHERLASGPRDALRARENQRQAVRLLDEYQRESRVPRKWLLFDAACHLGDLGDKNQSLPDWLSPALQSAPSLVFDVLRERITSLRGSRRK